MLRGLFCEQKKEMIAHKAGSTGRHTRGKRLFAGGGSCVTLTCAILSMSLQGKIIIIKSNETSICIESISMFGRNKVK